MDIRIEWTVEFEGSHRSDYVAANFVASAYVEKGEEAIIFALPENCHPGSDDCAEIYDTKITSIFDIEGTEYKQVGVLVVGSSVPEKYLKSEVEVLEEMAVEKMHIKLKELEEIAYERMSDEARSW